MRFEIKKINQDVYHILFYFKTQSCCLNVDTSGSDEKYPGMKYWHIISVTHGYHNIGYLLSNDEGVKKMTEYPIKKENDIITKYMERVGFGYFPNANKNTADIEVCSNQGLANNLDLLARLIQSRFSNRERFYKDNTNINQHEAL